LIYGVNGVILWTQNADKLFSFYKEILGLQVNSNHGDFMSFKWDNTRLNIGTHSEISGENMEPNRIMINLEVDDIQYEFNRLQSKGVIFISKPNKQSWGGWVCTFLDPDRNTLQLLEIPNR
jgi:predicted enzyme related to lactoylglutathione lyase